MDQLVVEQAFEKQNYTHTPLPKGEYDGCSFHDCVFAESDLSNTTFIDCHFEDCDLSNATLKDTGLKGVRFRNCKMLGLVYVDCTDFLFSVAYENCQLNFSSFYKINLRKTVFDQCSLVEVDFTEADLSEAVFKDCDLSGATFERTNLEKADLRTAQNYIFDPEQNHIKKAKFSLEGVTGLLAKYDIKISY